MYKLLATEAINVLISVCHLYKYTNTQTKSLNAVLPMATKPLYIDLGGIYNNYCRVIQFLSQNLIYY